MTRSLTYISLLAIALASNCGEPLLTNTSALQYVRVAAPSEPETDSVDVGVYLPPGYDAENEYPVLYFLHGWGEDEHAFHDNGYVRVLDSLFATGAVRAFIVVSPDGEHSGFLSWASGQHAGDRFIVDDLVSYIDANFNTAAARDGRSLSGTSMGGAAALRIGMSHPDIFGSISAHSAALHPVNPDSMADWARGWDGWDARYGHPIDREHWRFNNPLYLAQTVDDAILSSLDIYFDVGKEDNLGFNGTNEELHRILTERDIDHEFSLNSGGHGTEYVLDNIASSFLFHGRLWE